MAGRIEKTEVYLEMAQKRVIAIALDWPGWCRGGRDEASALDAFIASAPRYAKIVASTRLEFRTPADISALTITERVPGNATTDYGVPAMALPKDGEPVGETELDRMVTLLRACWKAFDRAVQSSEGKELRKGPRGGGRELSGIVRHVVESEAGYASRIDVALKWGDLEKWQDLQQALGESRDRIVDGLAEVAPLGIPAPGPRGGARWPVRYFVRRAAYHVVDHIWEIEDRMQASA